MKIVFVADVFVEDGILGGGELNNHVFCEIITSKGHEVIKIHSHELTESFIHDNKREYDFIIGNFLNIKPDVFKLIRKLTRYIIYEHDHKYLKSRNPALFKDFKAPIEDIVHQDFYSSAMAVLCQSSMHKSIVEKNLNLDNIHNLSGNLWSEDVLDFIEDLGTNEKQKCCSVMESPIKHKNTSGAVKFCIAKKIPYEIIPFSEYKEFLKRLSKNDSLAFFPETPETLSRIVVEARMLGCKIYTNDLIGATSEEWFNLKGKELINEMKSNRKKIPDFILSLFSKS